MIWDCCNAMEECQRGKGCPAGEAATTNQLTRVAADNVKKSCPPGMCAGIPDCPDHQCQAHPLLSGQFVRVPAKTNRHLTQKSSGEAVARIKSRMPRHPVAPEPSWRQFLPDLIKNLLISLGVVIFLAIVVWAAVDLFVVKQ